MYSTEELVKEHRKQMQQLRKEMSAAQRKMRLQEQLRDDYLHTQRKNWRYEPPKPKKTPLPMRILSILF